MSKNILLNYKMFGIFVNKKYQMILENRKLVNKLLCYLSPSSSCFSLFLYLSFSFSIAHSLLFSLFISLYLSFICFYLILTFFFLSFIPCFFLSLSHLSVENTQGHCGESKCSQTTYFALLNTFGDQL